jgi:type III pantothenate kinase
MRTLALNIGNTTLLGALFQGTRLSRRFRIPRAQSLRALEAALREEIGTRPIDRTVYCSVVPKLTDSLARILRKLTGRTPSLLNADAPHGLKIGYLEPRRLGTDRLAAVLGAQALIPETDLIVLDCGTATTVTALRADGLLCGGAILPGLGLWSEALATRTAQLPAITASAPARATGRSPEQAIASGLYHGHLGALERLTARIAAESFGKNPFAILATGGNARTFRREKLFTHIEPELILLGLLAFSANIKHDA